MYLDVQQRLENSTVVIDVLSGVITVDFNNVITIVAPTSGLTVKQKH